LASQAGTAIDEFLVQRGIENKLLEPNAAREQAAQGPTSKQLIDALRRTETPEDRDKAVNRLQTEIAWRQQKAQEAGSGLSGGKEVGRLLSEIEAMRAAVNAAKSVSGVAFRATGDQAKSLKDDAQELDKLLLTPEEQIEKMRKRAEELRKELAGALKLDTAKADLEDIRAALDGMSNAGKRLDLNKKLIEAADMQMQVAEHDAGVLDAQAAEKEAAEKEAARAKVLSDRAKEREEAERTALEQTARQRDFDTTEARRSGEARMEILRAEAAGQKEVAKALRDKEAIYQETARLMQEEGMWFLEANQRAQEKVGLERQIADAKEAAATATERAGSAERNIGETGRPLVDGRIDGRARNVDDVPLTATERLARGDRARDVARSEAEAARRRSRDQYASGESGFFSRPDPLADRFSGPDPLDRFRTPPAPPGLTPAPGAAGGEGAGGTQVAGGDAMQGAADKVGEAAVVQQAANASLTKASDQAIQAVQGFQEAVTSAIDGVSSAVDSLTHRLDTKLGELESKIDAAKNAI
jgi:hypothetical protein